MELVLKLEMKIVWSSGDTAAHYYFMFNHWWIPYSLMGDVI